MPSPERTSPERTVIVAGARTPIGKLSGAFKDLTAMDLGGFGDRGGPGTRPVCGRTRSTT